MKVRAKFKGPPMSLALYINKRDIIMAQDDIIVFADTNIYKEKKMANTRLER